MDLDEAWQAIDAQRLALADVLDQLTEREWHHPSLCDGWTVRDVAAHLTLQQLTAGQAVVQLIRFPRGPNRSIQLAARHRAALPTEQLVEAIRDMVGSRRHNVGVTHRETLIDVVVHGQDITVPLGRPLPVPPPAAEEAATRVWNIGWPFRARKRFAGFRLVATDATWAVGAGRRVEGPMTALLLLLTGRLVVLPQLSGDGAAAVRSRFPTPV
jgi:uncharacterized protein (TIGR03083 family)